MAIAAARLHARNERGLAHFERRSPLAGVSSTVAPASTTTAAQTEVIKLPKSVKAFAGAIVIFGLFILAVVFWKIRVWRRRRQNAASNLIHANEKQAGFGAAETRIDLEAAIVHTEKPSKALLLTPPVASSGVGWVPQLKPNLALPEPAKQRSHHAKKAWETNLAKLIAPATSNRSDSPPSYISSIDPTFPSAMPPPPPMPLSPPGQALPPTPPVTLKLNFDGIVPPPTQRPVMSPSAADPNPIVARRLSSSSRKSERKLPRLMNVSDAFEPSGEDELSLTVGETVRLLEEYEDEWCSIQRVGRIDAEKGVVPRFCLSERPEVVPLHPGLPSAGAYRR
jgi:hypothetical protein